MERSNNGPSGQPHRFLLSLVVALAMLAVPTVAVAKPTSASISKDTKGVSPVTSGGTSNYSAGSTGDGPSTDADCDRYANRMNSLTDLAIKLIVEGQDESGEIEFLNETIEATRDEAEDQGCFVID